MSVAWQHAGSVGIMPAAGGVDQMVVDFLIALVGALVLDRAGFWYLKNTAAQFSGEEIDYSYLQTLFPRIIGIIAGCGILAYCRSLAPPSDTMIVLGLILAIASHLVLYVRVIKNRSGRRNR